MLSPIGDDEFAEGRVMRHMIGQCWATLGQTQGNVLNSTVHCGSAIVRI